VLESANPTQGLPARIGFGSAFGRSALYVEFPRNKSVPERAFLVLSARDGAASDAGPVKLEAWRVSSPWQAESLERWSDKPALAPPFARAELHAASENEWRIDVSELVRFAAEHPDRAYGIAVLGVGGSGHGLSVATGMSGGRAPRLELYAR
jgi:hypothetical protein